MKDSAPDTHPDNLADKHVDDGVETLTAHWFEAPDPLLPEILALNGRWCGSKPAIICDETTLSWAEFHRQVCQMANGLRRDGLQTGERVAVLMSNSPEMMVALFGILSAGGVAVPLNIMVGDDGLVTMMQDANVRAVVVSADHAKRLAGRFDELPEIRAGARYCVDKADKDWQELNAWRQTQSSVDPQIELADGDECNIIYSSGTTGQPKGIVHTHRRRLDWFCDLAIALRVHRSSVNLCSIGLFSNISWAAMGCMIVTGSTLVIMRAFSADKCLAAMEQYGVTVTAMVPIQFQRLLDDPRMETAKLDSIESLMCCGSPLGVELKQAIMDRLSPCLIELYGLTEGLITTLEPEDSVGRLASVGKPLIGTDMLILDEHDQPCAPGEAGEIVGRGRILMSGYHGRREANEEATWTDGQGRRWLRTGDIGRLDESGFLYLVDRKKDLIISGGLNLYPADIEAVLVQHPGVVEAAVIGIASDRWGESPFAVIVTDSIQAPEAVNWANERVGKHQRLVGGVCVSELPRNPNGKVLKRELRREWRDWLNRQP